ncbi:MAG: 50S ribosomal protein L17 [Patescibacteria group bacterium]
MRHKHKTKTIDRGADSRRALIRGLATNLVLREKIKTTPVKAKVLRSAVEKYITLARNNNLTVRRELIKFFYTDSAVKKMLEVIGPRYAAKQGGYTRMVKIGPRKGDGAPIVQLELI